MKSVRFACILFALVPGHSWAGPTLIEQAPASAWKCEPLEKSAGPYEARFYFFVPPLEVDRYTPGAGLDRVGGISVIARMTADGKGDEYVFGEHRAYAQYLELRMRFTAVVSANGLRLRSHGEDADVGLIDRNTGEMRRPSEEPGSGVISCISAYAGFEDVAKAYHRLLGDEMKIP